MRERNMKLRKLAENVFQDAMIYGTGILQVKPGTRNRHRLSTGNKHGLRNFVCTYICGANHD